MMPSSSNDGICQEVSESWFVTSKSTIFCIQAFNSKEALVRIDLMRGSMNKFAEVEDDLGFAGPR